jgi:uroporphyrinogen-III decarboxylase
VAFVSDGDYSPLLNDLADLGFDGFVINANMNLAEIARRIGRDHFLIGNVSTSILTFGTPDDVRREVKRCLDDARPCAGHIIKATADLPHNIPLDNIRAYFRAADELSRTH